jgi:hypothetical protein
LSSTATSSLVLPAKCCVPCSRLGSTTICRASWSALSVPKSSGSRAANKQGAKPVARSRLLWGRGLARGALWSRSARQPACQLHRRRRACARTLHSPGRSDGITEPFVFAPSPVRGRLPQRVQGPQGRRRAEWNRRIELPLPNAGIMVRDQRSLRIRGWQEVPLSLKIGVDPEREIGA